MIDNFFSQHMINRPKWGHEEQAPRINRWWLVLALLFSSGCHAAACNDNPALQILGSGGPEITDKRRSSSYLIWLDGKARVLIDAGPGASVAFDQASAEFADLEWILFTHLHVDHAADLPALIKGSFFTSRSDDLMLLGPAGNRVMPGMTEYIEALFGSQGAYRYLSDFWLEDKRAQYKIKTREVNQPASLTSEDGRIKVRAVTVNHGPIPALAWRIDIDHHSWLISGDMSSGSKAFAELLKDTDTFVAHHAVPESASGVARRLHMPPSVIGELASEAGVGRLVLSHRMNRVEGVHQQSEKQIRQHYSGSLVWAEDGLCIDQ